MIIKENALYRQSVKGCKITFFTPTYNRAKYLNRIFTCLENQTEKLFVWILVNDGATDETGTIALDMLESEKIPMMYISKENGGKHSAFKAALENCKTTYIQCMDDDDLYLDNAVEFFINKWKQIKKREKGRYRRN